MIDSLCDYIRAGFAGLYVVTAEEVRAQAELRQAADRLGYGLHFWTVTRGILDPATGSLNPLTDPVDAVNSISDLPEKSMLVLADFHAFLGEPGQSGNPLLLRTLKDRLREAAAGSRVVVVLSGVLRIPQELEREFTVMQHALPDVATLTATAQGILTSANTTMAEPALEKAVEAARGLTTREAEDILALSVVRHRTLDPACIAREKALALRKDGILEIVSTMATARDIGGLEALKHWLAKRRNAFTHQAAEFGLPVPKGVLILGIPGTGKSLTAKAAASILERPLLKLDAGRLFAGIVGESEANLRRVTATAEAIAPCLLWVDEIEKGFAGTKSSGSSDGGTSARVFGSFLNWLQDKTAPVFVVATANDISQLPPELLRKGRFDEIFFVDLPDVREREAVWRIHIGKRRPDLAGIDYAVLARATDKFTGAEIEQVVVEALFECFDCETDLTQAALLEAAEHTVPLAVSMAESVTRLRQWSDGRARSAGTDQRSTASTARRIAA